MATKKKRAPAKSKKPKAAWPPADPAALLTAMRGRWRGKTVTYFEPGKVGDRSTWQGVIKESVNDRFFAHEYTHAVGRKPHRGLALYAYDAELQQFQCAWMDSFHMGGSMMFSTGRQTGPTSFAVTGTYGDGQGGQRWAWRTEVELRSARELALTAYNITPSGEEAVALETVYLRTG